MLRDIAGLTPLSSVRLTWCRMKSRCSNTKLRSVAEDEIRQRGFEVLSQDNRFIDLRLLTFRARAITYGGQSLLANLTRLILMLIVK